ncbi:MAG: hypothetical protein LQ343_005406 [Gyalolechia ehrenbergii]|nr:MAG: hypothetical protein LQ343_005406 [Gyalolechia ehrenbergii]
MSSIHYAHHRTSPPTTRKSVVKTTRSALLGASKVAVKGNWKVTETDTLTDEEEDDDDMATSFLQFCTTCDRQILVPKNSLLYCSERCKRIDAEYVPKYRSYTSPSRPVFNDESDTDAFGSKACSPVERAMPTPRPTLSARIPPKAHEGKSDLDPTEWKPKCPHRPTSDASSYLGQFHRKPPTSWSPRRPAAIHAQTMSSVPLTAPSLSATPSASSTSSSSDSVAGTPYNFANRSLMHSNSAAIKSVDLVTPQFPSACSVPAKPTGQTELAAKASGPPGAAENIALAGDLSYEKKWNLAHLHGSLASGSLTTLLGSTTLGHKATM